MEEGGSIRDSFKCKGQWVLLDLRINYLDTCNKAQINTCKIFNRVKSPNYLVVLWCVSSTLLSGEKDLSVVHPVIVERSHGRHGTTNSVRRNTFGNKFRYLFDGQPHTKRVVEDSTKSPTTIMLRWGNGRPDRLWQSYLKVVYRLYFFS